MPILLLLMLAILCGLLTYVFWYPVKDARAIAKLRACRNNLRQLSIAMNSYREANGHFPPKLSDLYPKYVSDLNTFSCPGDPHEIRSPRDIDSLSGYILFAVDTADTNSFDWFERPLLTDRRRNHLVVRNEVWVGNILHANRHVEEHPDSHPTDPRFLEFTNSVLSFNFPE